MIKTYLVEPLSSNILSGGLCRLHKIYGIGPGFIPGILKPEAFDGVFAISDEEAYDYVDRLAKKESIFARISSGDNVCASVKLAEKMKSNEIVVTILADNGYRYLSTPDFIKN